MWSLLVWDEPLLQKIIVVQSSACASFTCCTPDLTDIGNCYMQLLILPHKVLCNGTLAIPTVLRCPLAVWVSPCITSPCWLWSKAAKRSRNTHVLEVALMSLFNFQRVPLNTELGSQPCMLMRSYYKLYPWWRSRLQIKNIRISCLMPFLGFF